MPYKNKEVEKKWRKRWREKNLKYFREYSRQWREKNPECSKKYCKRYLTKNRGKIYAYHRQWAKTEKGKMVRQRGNIARRVRKNEIINTLTAEEWLDILKQHNFKCAYCGKDLFNLFDRPTRDHIIPISKGGNNIKENIVPACISCNSRKGNRI